MQEGRRGLSEGSFSEQKSRSCCRTGRGRRKPAAVNPGRTPASEDPPQTPLRSLLAADPCAAAHHTPLAVLPAGPVAYIPAHCPSLVPLLLPQQQGGAPYAIYLQPSSSKSNPLARPQPSSFAVRSMTFEDKTGQSPTAQCAVQAQSARGGADVSPLARKRMWSDSACESSPPKTRRPDAKVK